MVFFLNPPYQLFDGNIAQLNASQIHPSLWAQKLVETSQICFGAHAYYLPTTKFGSCSVSVPFIVSGPGIQKNAIIPSPLNLIDVAPTIAKILGIKPPKNCQGRVLHEILKD